MSDVEDAESDIPSREVCEERCQAFAAITATDSALAMFYLQDRGWDLQRSLDAYFSDNPGSQSAFSGSTGATPTPSPRLATVGDSLGATADMGQASLPATQGSSATQQAVAGGPSLAGQSKGDVTKDDVSSMEDPKPHHLRLLSWNIDGLDTSNLVSRTKGVAKTILDEHPDVVFLQEVIAQSQQMLEDLCPMYHVIPGIAGENMVSESYYTVIMLKVTSATYSDHNVQQFFSSLMGRTLLKVQAEVKGVSMLLMTSHLESTKSHDKERKRQLQVALKAMVDADKTRTVVFGGDLNLRDPELEQIGGLPTRILDVWEVTGKRPEAKFTWDMKRNDNLSWDGKFQPRCRFDRIYFRHCDGHHKLKPLYFELVGIQRLASCKRFPSDHWGVLTHYDLL